MPTPWDSTPAEVATPLTVSAEGFEATATTSLEALEIATEHAEFATVRVRVAHGRELYTLEPWGPPRS